MEQKGSSASRTFNEQIKSQRVKWEGLHLIKTKYWWDANSGFENHFWCEKSSSSTGKLTRRRNNITQRQIKEQKGTKQEPESMRRSNTGEFHDSGVSLCLVKSSPLSLSDEIPYPGIPSRIPNKPIAQTRFYGFNENTDRDRGQMGRRLVRIIKSSRGTIRHATNAGGWRR